MESASTPSPSINDETLQRIVCAVSQAVLSSMNGAEIHHTPQPQRLEGPTVELLEAPLVESGSEHLASITTPAPVAAAIHNITGDANFIQVSPASQSANLPTFNSVDVPIHVNMNPKIKA